MNRTTIRPFAAADVDEIVDLSIKAGRQVWCSKLIE